MPEVKVHSSPSNIDCPKYHPGHNTHWIPVLRVYSKTPRIPAKVSHVTGQEFLVTINGQSHNWFFHDPERLSHAIANNPSGIKSVQGTSFLNIAHPEGGIYWFNLAKEDMADCIYPQKGEVYEA
jgi:hypothetical protein